MSAEMIGQVFKLSKAKGSDRLMLLAIADWHNEEEGGCWASVQRLADKCNMNERNARYVLRSLEKLGELKTEIGGGKKTPHGNTNFYTIALESTVQEIAPRQLPDFAPQGDDGGQDSAPLGGQDSAPNTLEDTLISAVAKKSTRKKPDDGRAQKRKTIRASAYWKAYFAERFPAVEDLTLARLDKYLDVIACLEKAAVDPESVALLVRKKLAAGKTFYRFNHVGEDVAELIKRPAAPTPEVDEVTAARRAAALEEIEQRKNMAEGAQHA